ncbi:hypothetical protein G7046_g3075 [Stylonectria norvegica]|nr:hypothetical protein G7046_g3075 [Stylonectria norvegica]
MVIGLLAIAAIPTVIGVGQGISAQKKQNAGGSKEQEKFHLGAMMSHQGTLQEMGAGVLLFIDLPEGPVAGHKFCGYYFKYPSEEQLLGMVSTIADDPPMLNWIYVNKDTHAVEYGARKDTLGHVIGPWGWSEDERFLTLEGHDETFVAVREDGEGGPRWAVYWDPDGRILEEVGTQKGRRLQLRRNMQLGMETHIKVITMSAATMEKDRVSSSPNDVDTDDNTASSEEPAPPKPLRKKKKSKVAKRSKKQSSGPLDQLPVGGDTVGNAVGGVTGALGSVTNNAVDQQQGGGGGSGKSDTLRLRLDLNLDIEIQLKARIHGDLELALL